MLKFILAAALAAAAAKQPEKYTICPAEYCACKCVKECTCECTRCYFITKDPEDAGRPDAGTPTPDAGQAADAGR